MKAGTTKAQSASTPKTLTTAQTEPKAYHFLTPLPKGFHTKLLESKAEQATGERKTKLRVMASLYSGHDYSKAAEENHVPLGNVYLWLADFRRGGLAAL
ncbi:helix-turn-helix domain containing protein [Pararhizobium sp. BT-229]|uniref:helix-turn-helix domain-containing protein n=1 Tax=Pararhizobium sp. BT-229 TaxID=2986923 RepID=UPI0021F72245|nr:helix-turn-helix domain-containing protein [Pararhizobium sp. BT-229]MCV9963847.1 helix-turn-helix domain containing protein [Pararhizobium sp. BT-229]